jgi:hypothetical protein
VPAPGKRGRISNRAGSVPFRDRGTGLSDRAMVRVLARLDELGGGTDSPWPEQCAAHLRIDGLLSDAALADRFNVEAADVARVRANVAAGHPPAAASPTPTHRDRRRGT